MKGLAITLLLMALLSTPCHAETCHDLVMSYVIADQENPKQPGDEIKDGATNSPILMETTAYYEGTRGSHGDKMREGYCAGSPDLYGASVAIYKAIPDEEKGGYKLGDFIGFYELRDTGYGYSTGEGKSEVRTDKRYAGTIETGVHLDIYRDNYKRCKEWMQQTQGKIFAVIVPDVKG